MREHGRLCLASVTVAVLLARPLAAQTATRPGKFSVEPPTLLSLGFEVGLEVGKW